MERNYLKLIVGLILICCSTIIFAQSNLKNEALLTSKKWTCLDVSRKKLEKMEFRFEVGNELSLRIDKKYSFKNNDYNYQSGTWKLDGKDLYFFYQAAEGDSNRKLTSTYRIQKLTPNELRLKRMDRPKGKLVFK